MAQIEYLLMEGKIKDIAAALAQDEPLPPTQMTDTNELKSANYNSDYSVMTVCDNFVTIYSYPTWKKKFGR